MFRELGDMDVQGTYGRPILEQTAQAYASPTSHCRVTPISASRGLSTRSGGPPPEPEAVWWVDDDGTPLGPSILPQLRARLADGRSHDATLVWRDGKNNWVPAASALP